MEKRVSVNLRLPPEIHAELRQVAAEEERSLNTQIVRFLRWALERYRAEHSETPPPDQPE